MPPCYRSKFRGGFSIRKITSSASLYIEERSTTLQHDCSAISLAQFGVTGKDIGYCVGNDLISIDTGDFVLFQSTFPRGERRSKRSDSDYFTDFNPRSRVGNDDVRQNKLCLDGHFNPRSRVGNDAASPAFSYMTSYFNPRSRVGNDGIYGTGSRKTTFQSTFPRGERRRSLSFCFQNYNFNPRSRVGNDLIAWQNC